MTIPTCDPARPITGAPGWTLPHGAVDCHFHVFGPDSLYPHAPARSYTPPEASLAAYEQLCDRLGITRAVIVQPSPYGFDNRRTLDVMQESRLDTRAILVLDEVISDDLLAMYHRKGVRGVRLNLLFKAGAAMSLAERLADRIRGLGWHIQFLADVSTINDLPRIADKLRLPLVFDHLGHVPAAKGVRDPGFQALLALLREGRAWVKLSAPYRTTGGDDLPYDDVRGAVDALLAANPDRLVWGTDWPHPMIPILVPDDIALVNLFQSWIPDHELRRQIMVDNACRLYDFDIRVP